MSLSNLHGTVVLDASSGLVQHACGRAWIVDTQPGGNLPRRWWACLDGCHD